jgi:hypothetical protein
MTDGINLYLFHVKWELLLTRIIDEDAGTFCKYKTIQAQKDERNIVYMLKS